MIYVDGSCYYYHRLLLLPLITEQKGNRITGAGSKNQITLNPIIKT